MRIDLLNGNYIELHGDEAFVGEALIALASLVDKMGSVRRRVETEIEQAAESASTKTEFNGKHVSYLPESENASV